jgi:hypothetical protein
MPGPVLMDNLPVHKVAGVAEAIEAAGATLIYLPKYSPDLKPIELAQQTQGASAQGRRAYNPRLLRRISNMTGIHSSAILAGDDPKAVVLDFVQPQRAGRRHGGFDREARRDEAGEMHAI